MPFQQPASVRALCPSPWPLHRDSLNGTPTLQRVVRLVKATVWLVLLPAVLGVTSGCNMSNELTQSLEAARAANPAARLDVSTELRQRWPSGSAWAAVKQQIEDAGFACRKRAPAPATSDTAELWDCTGRMGSWMSLAPKDELQAVFEVRGDLVTKLRAELIYRGL
jgi:hypothetical protein